MRILILGAGSIGRRHLANLLAIGEKDVWVYDTDDAKVQAAIEAGGRPFPEPSNLDAVLICSPPNYHAGQLVTWHACKVNTFVEKPITDGDPFWSPMAMDQIGKSGKVCMVGYHMRFHKGLLNARHHWDEIGFPVRIDATYSQALPTWRPGTDYCQNYLMSLEGGIILEQSHEIDYCRWLAGEVEAIECVAGNTGRYGMASYDWANIVLHHKLGTESHIHLDCTGDAISPGYRTPHYLRDCHITGTEGVIHWSYDGYLLIDSGGKQIKRAANAGFNMGDRAYQDEMRHFLACCRGEASPVVNGVEGARVLEIALKCVESAKRKGERVEV